MTLTPFTRKLKTLGPTRNIETKQNSTKFHEILFSSSILHFQNFRDVCHFQNGCQNTALKMGGKNSTLSDIIKI
jgi:hypothetical protein